MTPQEIISDDEIARVHGNANFGAMDPREVVNDGVRKTAVGYHCGSTQLHILRDHGLVTKPRSGSSDVDLTKKGKAYARSIYRDTTPARAEAQDEGAAGPWGWVIGNRRDGKKWFSQDHTAVDAWVSDPDFFEVTPVYRAHPSPTPAADADRVRIAVEALEDAAHEAHGRGYVQGFADAVWDDTGDYDEKALTENLDPEKLRDGWYDDARHTYRDAQTKALAALQQETQP